MLKIEAHTQEEIQEQFKVKKVELKRAVAEAVLDVLEGKENKAVFVLIVPQGIGLRVEKKDFLTALESNLDVFISDENFETAAKMKNWIDKIKENPELYLK